MKTRVTAPTSLPPTPHASRKAMQGAAGLRRTRRLRRAGRTILLGTDNKVLLFRCNPIAVDPKNPDTEPYWITPGGALESGESPEQAARRELFEETGIDDAEFQKPHIYYAEYELIHRGVLTLFQEYFFIARTHTQLITTKHRTAYEQQDLLESRWWSLDEIKTNVDEIIYPENLVDLIDAANEQPESF